MRGLKQAVWACFVISTFSAAVWAAEDKKNDPADAKPTANVTANDIALWIKELDADILADRRAAGEKLFAAGRSVIPALAIAAESDNAERAIRSFDLLQRFYESEDENAKEAAKSVLVKLMKSNNLGASRLAFRALNPVDESKSKNGADLDQAGDIQYRKAISINSETNGSSQKITFEEDDRKVVIEKHPDGSIKMEIIDTINGRELKHAYEAKESGLLKLKSKEAYEIYAKVMTNFADEKGAIGFIQRDPVFRGADAFLRNLAGAKPNQLNPFQANAAGANGPGANVPAVNPQGNPGVMPPRLGNAPNRQAVHRRQGNDENLSPELSLIRFNNLLKLQIQTAEMKEGLYKNFPEKKREAREEIKEYRRLLQEIEKNLDTVEQQLDKPAPQKAKDPNENPPAENPQNPPLEPPLELPEKQQESD